MDDTSDGAEPADMRESLQHARRTSARTRAQADDDHAPFGIRGRDVRSRITYRVAAVDDRQRTGPMGSIFDAAQDALSRGVAIAGNGGVLERLVHGAGSRGGLVCGVRSDRYERVAHPWACAHAEAGRRDGPPLGYPHHCRVDCVLAIQHRISALLDRK